MTRSATDHPPHVPQLVSSELRIPVSYDAMIPRRVYPDSAQPRLRAGRAGLLPGFCQPAPGGRSGIPGRCRGRRARQPADRRHPRQPGAGRRRRYLPVAGTGSVGFSGDGGPAISAEVAGLQAAVAAGAILLISDSGNLRVRLVQGQARGRHGRVSGAPLRLESFRRPWLPRPGHPRAQPFMPNPDIAPLCRSPALACPLETRSGRAGRS